MIQFCSLFICNGTFSDYNKRLLLLSKIYSAEGTVLGFCLWTLNGMPPLLQQPQRPCVTTLSTYNYKRKSNKSSVTHTSIFTSRWATTTIRATMHVERERGKMLLFIFFRLVGSFKTWLKKVRGVCSVEWSRPQKMWRGPEESQNRTPVTGWSKRARKKV